jgi:two-component system, OmpR family, alkaline phosphatase synthesis response regulator PhoP
MKKNTVLIIEDDSSLIRGLKDSFTAKGFEVKTAMDGETGLAIATSDPIDIVILDVMLPKLNGYQVCQGIRECERYMPIIMLTAKGQESDIIRGLNLGADDYVTKPFSILELLARANAFLRKNQQAEQYTFGDFTLDVDSHKLYLSGEEIALTPKEFGLLEFFIKRAGHALSRETILNAVWKSSVMTTARSVDRCVTTLRKKIEANPGKPQYIKSIRDIGYRFERGHLAETNHTTI